MAKRPIRGIPNDGPLVLHPMTFDDAVTALLKAKPPRSRVQAPPLDLRWPAGRLEGSTALSSPSPAFRRSSGRDAL
jgi:hypothetical protein